MIWYLALDVGAQLAFLKCSPDTPRRRRKCDYKPPSRWLVILPAAPVEGLHRLSNCHGLDADRDHATEQVDAALLVIGEAVSVEFFADGRVARGFFLVLVKHPVDRASVAGASRRVSRLVYRYSRSGGLAAR